MLNLILKTKPLSVNQAWQGRRFKTTKYKDYEKEITALLRQYKLVRGVFKGKVGVDIIFFLKRASATDIDNPVKLILDVLVKNGIIEDDRNIWKLKIEKKKSDRDFMEIEISKIR